MIEEFINPSLLAGGVALGLFAGILGCLEWGRRAGMRKRTRNAAGDLSTNELLQGAVFTLLALLIGFTFSGALNRFDLRRSQAVDEANAVGTAYLRVALLPPPAQPRLRALFRAYTDSRIATYTKLPDLEAALAERARTQELQAALWAEAVAA